MKNGTIDPSAITKTAVKEDLVARLKNLAFFVAEFATPRSAERLVEDLAGTSIDDMPVSTSLKIAQCSAEDYIRTDHLDHLHCYHLAMHLYEYVFEARWDRHGRSSFAWQADVELAALHLEDFVNSTSAMATRTFVSIPANGSCEYIMNAAHARLKLDRMLAVSLRELALITRLKEKTIRNQASMSETGLVTRREGGRAYLDMEHSSSWLENRIETTIVYDSFPQQLTDWLQRLNRHFGENLDAWDAFIESHSASAFVQAWREGRFDKEYEHEVFTLFSASEALGILDGMQDRAHLRWALDQVFNYG